MIENTEADNYILGSVIIDIPEREFEKIEITGGFSQFFIDYKFGYVYTCKPVTGKS